MSRHKQMRGSIHSYTFKSEEKYMATFENICAYKHAQSSSLSNSNWIDYSDLKLVRTGINYRFTTPSSFSLYTCYSGWISCLISFVWALPSCEERGREPTIQNTSIHVYIQRDSNQKHFAQNWKLSKSLRPLANPTDILNCFLNYYATTHTSRCAGGLKTLTSFSRTFWHILELFCNSWVPMGPNVFKIYFW